MNLRDFWRFHFLKTLLALVVLQLAIVAIIQNYNHKPEAMRDELNVIEDRPLKIKPLINDSDKDDHTEFTLASFTKPIHGTAIQKGNALLYTPNKDFIGTDSLQYIVSDGKKESKPGYIVINVAKNMPAMPKRDLAMVYAGGKLLINPLANDEDQENDSLFIKEYSKPLYGTVTQVGNDLYYKAGTIAKADSFYYTVGDAKSVSEKAYVYVQVKSKTDPCYPWLSVDVGDVALPGNLSCANGKYIVEASGSDIWNPYDGFNFSYQAVEGDCEMITKVVSLEANHEWAKAGIMIRETLAGGSANAYFGFSAQHGAGFQCRFGTEEGTNGTGGNDKLEVPYWIKLSRKGDVFIASLSADGKSWEELGKQEIKMKQKALMGFSVTSHNNEELGKAIFSNVKLKK